MCIRDSLTRVYKKAVATAEAGGRVVMVVQEAPQEGQQKSRRAYQNLSSNGAAVDEVLFFPAGTIAFGHAAGWTNATESAYANTHAWAGGGEDPLRPPRCRQPGVLRRHSRLMNPRDVRVLLFASRRDDVTRMVGTEALRRLAFVAGGTGGRCLLYTSPSPRDGLLSRMPSSA